MRLLILLLISTSAFSQENTPPLLHLSETNIPGIEMRCSKYYNNWNDPLSGFFQLVNTINKTESPIFSLPENCKPFSMDLMYDRSVYFILDSTASIYAQINDKVGALDVYGNEVRPFEFDNAMKAGNLSLLKKGKKWYLDTLVTAKLIPIGKGEIVGYGGRWDDFVLLKNGEKSTFAERTGIVGETRKYLDPFNHITRETFMIHRNDSAGLVNSQGEIMFEISDIRLAAGNSYWIATKDGKKAMINTEGKLVTEYMYEQINASHTEGFTIYRAGNKEGIMDFNGNELTPPIYNDLRPLINGLIKGYLVLNDSRRYGCLNAKGETTIPFEYENEINFFQGLAFVGKDDKYGFINEQNEVVIDFRFDYTSNVKFEEGWAQVKLNGKYVLVDKAGNTLETSFKEK